MKNAIVILNYNDFQMTKKLVDHILKIEKMEKIIIVDNCSLDNSLSYLKNEYDTIEKIDVINTKENNGYATGNNFGINFAIEKYNPEYILVANPDIFFNEDVIIEINTVFEENDDIAILAPMVSKGYNSWQLPNFSKTLASNFLLLSKMFGNKVYKNQKERINYVDVVAGSLFAIRGDIFKKVNGFDERTFLYYEENILAFKIKSLGYKSAILGNVTYDHCHAASIKKTYKSKLHLFKIINKSIRIYIYYYLKINFLQKIIFDFCSIIAYIERFLYDIYSRIMNRGK